MEENVINRPKKKKVLPFMRTKMFFIVMLVLVCFGLLIVRIVYIRNNDGDRYAKKVLSQQSYVSTSTPYKRGTIYDRNGLVLAESEKVYNIILDPKVLLTYDINVNPTIQNLCEVFGFEESEIRDILEKNPDSSYEIIRQKEGFETVAEYQSRAATNARLKGVWFEVDYQRKYPYSELASHVIGYTNSGNAGAYGIEQQYNEELNGTNGKTFGYYDTSLNLVNTVKKPKDGNSIVSTVDVYLQDIVERYVEDFRENVGCNNIGVILMNPNNGEILAMASNEEFDLNSPRELVGHVDGSELDSMDEQQKMDSLYKLWRNFCVNDTYEPGSTFKPITVASALEEAAASENNTFYCKGYEEVGGWKIGCNNPSGHGELSLAESLMKSCNCALIKISAELGREGFYKYEKNFGFGELTGIDLPGEVGGILIPEKNLNITELATSSFGLRFNITMVQMVAAFSSIVNGGNYYQPHVMDKIIDENGNTVKSYDAEVLKKTVSAETVEFMRKALYKTVTEGTALPAQVEGYLIGGKTGTAQKLPREDKKYVVSFIGCAPINDPQLVAYIVMDEIHDEEVKGSSSPATGMFSSIMREALPAMGIYPEGEIAYNSDLLQILEDGERTAFKSDGTAEPAGIAPENEDEEEGSEEESYANETHVNDDGSMVVVYDPTKDESNPDVLPDMGEDNGNGDEGEVTEGDSGDEEGENNEEDGE